MELPALPGLLALPSSARRSGLELLRSPCNSFTCVSNLNISKFIITFINYILDIEHSLSNKRMHIVAVKT